MPTLDPATQFFTDTFARWLRGSGTVYRFRESTTRLLTTGRGALSLHHQQLALELTTEAAWADIWKDPQAVANPAFQADLARALTDSASQTVRGCIDSACAVFAHSVVDAATFDYCQATALAAPQDWEPDLQDRKAPLSEIKGHSYAEILQDRLAEYLKDLEKKSLLQKLDRLHARCLPPAGWEGLRGYRYEPDRVDAFDQLRHDVVHGDALGRELTGLDDELDYMRQTCFYMMALVNKRYDLRIDLTRWSLRMSGG